MATLGEYYTASYNSQYNFYGVDYYAAQSFTIGAVGTNVAQIIDSLKLSLFRTAGLDITAYIEIKAMDVSGNPTGNVLSSGTIQTTTIPTTPFEGYVTINMTSYELQPSTEYMIIIRTPDADSSNYLSWSAHTPGGYDGGNSKLLYLGTTYDYTNDFLFEIWVILVVWYNANWDYRRAIEVTNNVASALTDFQVLFTLDTAALVTAGKMQADGDDIIFADLAGVAQDYWIESGMNTNTTKIWVEVKTIGASATKDIYLYYGNAGASTASSGANTFEEFFDKDSTAGWTTNGDMVVSTSGDYLKFKSSTN
ncbi:DUF2341 domain-containing protein, partial [archaeon]|nr:DUF2341 domain-containing protein [archaeon]